VELRDIERIRQVRGDTIETEKRALRSFLFRNGLTIDGNPVRNIQEIPSSSDEITFRCGRSEFLEMVGLNKDA